MYASQPDNPASTLLVFGHNYAIQVKLLDISFKT
jgi:hypothetical protein